LFFWCPAKGWHLLLSGQPNTAFFFTAAFFAPVFFLPPVFFFAVAGGAEPSAAAVFGAR
jgi:hypothetical protein